MTFDDASANADQKFIAPPKRHFFEKIIDSEKKIFQKSFSASKNEKLQIVRNAFCQSFTPIGAMFEGFRFFFFGVRRADFFFLSGTARHGAGRGGSAGKKE